MKKYILYLIMTAAVLGTFVYVANVEPQMSEQHD